MLTVRWNLPSILGEKFSALKPNRVPLRHLDRLFAFRLREHDCEFLAAVTVSRIDLSDVSADNLGHACQDMVPFQSSETLVDGPEVVDIEHQDRQRKMVPVDALDFRLQVVVKVLQVEEPGQAVSHAQVLEFLLDLIQLLFGTLEIRYFPGISGQSSSLPGGFLPGLVEDVEPVLFTRRRTMDAGLRPRFPARLQGLPFQAGQAFRLIVGKRSLSVLPSRFRAGIPKILSPEIQVYRSFGSS